MDLNVEAVPLRAVLFDFDGVVVRSMEDHFEGWRLALAEFEIEMQPEELYIREGSALEEIASQITRKFNLPYTITDQLIEKKRHYYDQIKKIEFYPYLLDLLDWIEEMGIKVGLVTGGDRDRVGATLSEFGMADRFEVVVTADDVQHTKPSPEPYLMAAQMLGIEPGHCVVIENAPLGIQSAKIAGMRCIAVTSTLSPSYLKAADVVASDLSEVLNAVRRMY